MKDDSMGPGVVRCEQNARQPVDLPVPADPIHQPWLKNMSEADVRLDPAIREPGPADVAPKDPVAAQPMRDALDRLDRMQPANPPSRPREAEGEPDLMPRLKIAPQKGERFER